MNMRNKLPGRMARHAPGFTLMELLISMFIVTLLTAGLLVFMIDVSRGIFWGTEKAEISEDVRSFTMQIAAEARSSNSFIIYSSFNEEDRNQNTDQRRLNESGDCLVLANTEFYPDPTGTAHYTDVVVYYRQEDEEEDGAGPVHRLAWSADSPSQYYDTTDYTIEEVLELIAPADADDTPIVIELSRGVANGRLFTNHLNRTVVINGEILHGNKVKEVTNTYNLTISPRG